MIAAVTPQTVPRFLALCREETCIGLRAGTAWACYGPESAVCRFYLADDSAALCIQGESALGCGFVGDTAELAAFLRLNRVKSFVCESMLLTEWTPAPLLCMRFTGAQPDVYTAETEVAPNLWELAHSGLLGANAEVWYADVCARANRGLADVRAVRADGSYAATAGAYCVREQGVYLTGVATCAAYRGRGFATTLLSGLCRRYADRPLWLLCRPALQGFYEQRGFALAAPVCEAHAPLEHKKL